MQGEDLEKTVGGLVWRTELKEPEGVTRERLRNQVAFNRISEHLKVVYRSRPQHNYLLVKGLKEKGEVVAATGDGAGDSPTLKTADVGLAMGIVGTCVAKDAADIIIEDDNFCSIVEGVKWGRHIHHSVQRLLQF